MSVIGATLAGNYDPAWAILGGLVGGLVFLAVVGMGYGVGMTRMNFLRILGTMMLPRASGATVYGVGLIVHLMASAGFGLIHAALLHAIGIESVTAAAGWDLVIGLVHGVGILVALPMMLAAMHPLVRSGELESPGAALVGFGQMTPVGSLMAHAVFGLVNGWIYAAGVL